MPVIAVSLSLIVKTGRENIVQDTVNTQTVNNADTYNRFRNSVSLASLNF